MAHEMNNTDKLQTEGLIASMLIQIGAFPADSPSRSILQKEVTRLQNLISPPPPPPPGPPQGILPPAFKITEMSTRDVDPKIIGQAMDHYNKGKEVADQVDIGEFIKIKQERLTFYFKAYYYCGKWYAAPPKDHPAWNDFVAFAGEDAANDSQLYDFVRVE